MNILDKPLDANAILDGYWNVLETYGDMENDCFDANYGGVLEQKMKPLEERKEKKIRNVVETA